LKNPISISVEQKHDQETIKLSRTLSEIKELKYVSLEIEGKWLKRKLNRIAQEIELKQQIERNKFRLKSN